MLHSAFAGLSLGSHRPCPFVKQGSSPRRVAQPLIIEAAHKKGGGSTKNGRDSTSKRRGVKVYGGQPVKAGGIIIRQVGSSVHAGTGVGQGKDYTLFALKPGIVVFKKNKFEKQVTVVDFGEYEKPEGCRVQEGSRKMKRKQQYSSRKPDVVSAAPVVGP